MGVTKSTTFGDDAHTPICNSCGISLCWDISDIEYQDSQSFWDNWECRDCNPNYKGALKRHKENQK